jgi:dienelactone hydrolase
MNISSRQIQYSCGETTHQGYFAWDSDGDEPRPGIIVIHEWWGLNAYIHERARMLAEMGYCALGIDMYGAGLVAETPDQAGAAMNAVLEDMETGTARLQAAYDTLVGQPEVDEKRTAAIGYCFGGAMALHMARKGFALNAAVSFHGALGSFHTPAPGEVKAKILVCHGGGDAMVSMDDVAAFRQEMDNAEVDYEVIVHPDAPHGFSSKEADTNGEKYGIPVGYDGDADAASWNAMQSLFKQCF